MTEVPFNLKGKIFRSPMPFGDQDPKGELMKEYSDNEVSVIAPLTSGERT